MTIVEALILGIVQGLTEFLPVSSSGHIELGKALLGIELEDDLTFTVLVHAATTLSILVVFYKDILSLISGVLKFSWNPETRYVLLLAVSMIPVGLVAVFYKDQIELMFNGQTAFVGAMLLVTSAILFLTRYAPKEGQELKLKQVILIGLAQAVAVLPGISRSGATIGLALLLGVKREQATRFSFLMVLAPILGYTFLQTLDLLETKVSPDPSLAVGFLAAFLSGLIACKWMINIVRKGKIVYFSIYCLLIGTIAIASTFI